MDNIMVSNEDDLWVDEQIQQATNWNLDTWCMVLDEWETDDKALIPVIMHLMNHYDLSHTVAQAIATCYKWRQWSQD